MPAPINKNSPVWSHFLTPFTYTMAEGKYTLTLEEKFKAFALLILGFPLACVGGPLLFYAYTAQCKARHFQQLHPPLKLTGANPREPIQKLPIFPLPPTPPSSETPEMRRQTLGRWLPELITRNCLQVDSLKERIENNFAYCNTAYSDKEKRQAIAQTSSLTTELSNKVNDIAYRLSSFINNKKGADEDIAHLAKVRTELLPLQNFVGSIFQQLAHKIESLPLNVKENDEISLLKNLPTVLQRNRFEAILRTKFQRHDITGNGACCLHSIVNGLYPAILEHRAINREEALAEEAIQAANLRREIADYMEENVQNYDLKKKTNADGTEPYNFAAYCTEAPGPDGIRETTNEVFSFSEYLKELRKPTTWFGDQEIFAVSQKYKVCIEVYKAGCVEYSKGHLVPLWIYGKEHKNNPKSPAPIALYHNGGHYEIMTKLQKAKKNSIEGS